MELSISQVISGTFGMVRQRFGSLLGVYLIYFGLMLGAVIVFALVGGGAMAGMAGLGDPGAMGAGLGAGMFLVMIIFYVAYIVLALAQVVSLTSMASPLHTPSVGQALGTGLRSWLTLLGLLGVMILAYFVFAIVGGLLGAVFMAMGTGGAVVFGLIMLVGLVYVGCRMSVLYPVLAVEGQRNPLTAIARSWRLTSGSVLPIFIVTLIFIVIILVAFGLALAPIIGTFTAMAMGSPMGMDDAAAPAMGAVFGSLGLVLVLSVLVSIVYASFMATLHAALSGTTGEDLGGTFE